MTETERMADLVNAYRHDAECACIDRAVQTPVVG
jgi:hypothetical protein